MASTPIAEGILLIASVTVAALLSGAVISKIYSVDSTLSQIISSEKSALMLRARFVHLACLSNTSYVAYVKNLGPLVLNLGLVDVLIGPPGSEVAVWSLGGSVSVAAQSGGSQLMPGGIGVINITLPQPPSPTVVSVKLVYPNGASEYMICSSG